MARKTTPVQPVRAQDVRFVRTNQHRAEPATHTAAAQDGCSDHELDACRGEAAEIEKPVKIHKCLALIVTLGTLGVSGCSGDSHRTVDPKGADTTMKTDALKAGAAALQTSAPLSGMDVYLSGFHPMKDDPSHQMEAHHFCRQVNEDFAQCALFDGNTESANLNGIEYIISEKLFATLPAGERKYWHPHNYEILSGQLVAPGLPSAASKELMRSKMNSYGKTFHLWSTNMGDKLPMGDAKLAWSFNRDGEAKPELAERRTEKMGIDLAEVRRERQDLIGLAKPQEGVDELNGKFPRPTQAIPGVVDARSAQDQRQHSSARRTMRSQSAAADKAKARSRGAREKSFITER
jgi:hypothetical protein